MMKSKSIIKRCQRILEIQKLPDPSPLNKLKSVCKLDVS